MNYIPVTQTRRDRKQKRIIISTKTLLYVIFQISIFSIVMLLPVFAQSFVGYGSTLLSLSMLFLFGAAVVYVAIRLFIVLSNRRAKGKHAMKSASASRRAEIGDKQKESLVLAEPRMKNSWIRGAELVLTVIAWGFFLYLLEPFITAVLWWRGYKLIEGKALSLDAIQEIFFILETFVYFGITVFLLLFSWSRWNSWRCEKLNRRRLKNLAAVEQPSPCKQLA